MGRIEGIRLVVSPWEIAFAPEACVGGGGVCVSGKRGEVCTLFCTMPWARETGMTGSMFPNIYQWECYCS